MPAPLSSYPRAARTARTARTGQPAERRSGTHSTCAAWGDAKQSRRDAARHDATRHGVAGHSAHSAPDQAGRDEHHALLAACLLDRLCHVGHALQRAVAAGSAAGTAWPPHRRCEAQQRLRAPYCTGLAGAANCATHELGWAPRQGCRCRLLSRHGCAGRSGRTSKSTPLALQKPEPLAAKMTPPEPATAARSDCGAGGCGTAGVAPLRAAVSGAGTSQPWACVGLVRCGASQQALAGRRLHETRPTRARALQAHRPASS